MKLTHTKLGARIFAAPAALALFSSLAAASETSTASPAGAAEAPSTFLSCTISALDAGETQRHHELIGRLQAAISEQRELADGYAFRLAESFPLADLAEWISLERRCCPFFGFVAEVKPGERELWLHLNGGPEVKQFLRAVKLVAADAGSTK